MQSLFVGLLLLLPVTMAIRCFIGTDMNFMQDDCKGNAKGSNFCYKEDGCKEGVCCCSTGDYCNGAAGSGIISAFLVAATAWLRL